MESSEKKGTALVVNFWLALILGTLRGASYLLPKCLITQIKLLECSGLAREEGVCMCVC